MTTEEPVVTEDQSDVDLTDHPDNMETELADDMEIDALVAGVDPSAPVLTGEENA